MQSVFSKQSKKRTRDLSVVIAALLLLSVAAFTLSACDSTKKNAYGTLTTYSGIVRYI